MIYIMFKRLLNDFAPSIIIWNIELRDKESNFVCQNFYFLSYKRAKKFLKRNEKEYDEYNITLGGEPLWLL